MPTASRLDHLIAHASGGYQNILTRLENRWLWKSVKIRAENRDTELRQVRELYGRLREVHAATAFAQPDMPHRLAIMMAAEVFRETGAPTGNDALLDIVGRSAAQLLANEIFFEFSTIDFSIPLAMDECLALRAYLEEKRRFLLASQQILKNWSGRFTDMWAVLFASLPDAAFQAQAAQTASALTLERPLVSAIPDAKSCIQKLTDVILTDPPTGNVFSDLTATITNNIWTASGVAEADRATTKRSPVLPCECREPKESIADTYLSGTPFLPLFKLPLPLEIKNSFRFEHCHIMAGTGHGKTQLMQSMMLRDFDDPDRPAVVAIDSQGDMMRTLARLERFNPRHDDRLIILDPADTEWPLRLNLFDVNRDRIDALPRGEREQLLAGIVELYDYIFGALLGAELTQKQSVVFRFLAQLMLAIPNATIHTLRQLLEDPAPYWSHVEQLPPTAKTFLTEHLFVATKRGQKPNDYNATRAQVLRRLYGILSNPTFERLFSHPKNAVDMKQALDRGKVVLVNTAKDVLKAEASAIFGRYIIALILKSALERAADAKAARRPAFVYIDEAADYFDDTIDTLLIQARKYNVGLTIAHQFLDQLTPALRASVMSNPAIRFAGGLSSKDAAALKDDMRTSSEFLLGLRKASASSQFACYVRHLTPTALTYDLKLGVAEREPKMSPTDYDALLARVRGEVAAPISETMAHVGDNKPASAENKSADEPDDFADSY